MTQKKILLTKESIASLATDHQPPCLSLYQPTHRYYPENKQDPIRFRNLVKDLEISLRQKYPTVETHLLMEPFEALAKDREFWNHTLDGLAVMRGLGLFQVFLTQRPVAELAIVADSFHLKPLRRLLQSVDRYQILGLSLDKIRLFEGNRDAIDEIDLVPGVPRTIEEALGDQLTEPHLTVRSLGGTGQSGTAMRHGHGAKKDEVDIEAERFFRVIDSAILEYYSRPSGLPLILAALSDHQYLFHRISHNPFLMTEGINLNLDAISTDELQERAWQVVEPQYQAQLSALIEEFVTTYSKGLGSADLVQVAHASVNGKIATLLIESDRQIPGRLDIQTGKIELANLDNPQIDDLLDDLGELVEKKGGQVMIIPSEQMPSQTGLAAIYRY